MKRLAFLVIVAVVTLLSSKASATLYIIGGTYGGANPDYGVYSWTVNSGSGPVATVGLVGAIKLEAQDPSSPNLIAICTDVQADLYLGRAYNFSNPRSFSQIGNGSLLSWGASTAARGQALQNAAYIFYHNQNLLVGNNLDDKAAVQLAVWAALYNTDASDSHFTVTGANQRFSVTGGDSGGIAKANQLLAALWNAGSFGHIDGHLLQPLTQDGRVDTGAQELFAFAALPEPETLLAALMLLAPLGVSIVRSVKRRASN